MRKEMREVRGITLAFPVPETREELKEFIFDTDEESVELSIVWLASQMLIQAMRGRAVSMLENGASIPEIEEFLESEYLYMLRGPLDPNSF